MIVLSDSLRSSVVMDARWKGKVAGSIPVAIQGFLHTLKPLQGRRCCLSGSAAEKFKTLFFLLIFGSVNLHFLARRMPLALRRVEYLPRRATSCEEANWRIYTVASQSQAVTTVTALADIRLVLEYTFDMSCSSFRGRGRGRERRPWPAATVAAAGEQGKPARGAEGWTSSSRHVQASFHLDSQGHQPLLLYTNPP